MKLKATHQLALGNGTRPKDFVFGTVVFKGEIYDAVRAAGHGQEGRHCDMVLAEGVTPKEFRSALMNLNIATYLDDEKAEAAETESVDWRQLPIEGIKFPKRLKEKLAGLGVTTLGQVESIDQNELTESEQNKVLGVVAKYETTNN